MTTATQNREETHFYIDNAPPDEVVAVLRVLSPSQPLAPADIAALLASDYGIAMQKDVNYSPRRLYDLGLSVQRIEARKTLYTLSAKGVRTQALLAADPDLAMDVLHYLHFSGYSGKPEDRKLLWSYRRCCEITWQSGHTIPNLQMAATLQAEVREHFSHLDLTARVGGRVDASAAGRVLTWLCALAPAPICPKGGPVMPRSVERLPLALLALDDTYRARQMRLGDAIMLTDEVLHQIAGVFFLDTAVCRKLLQIAPRLTSAVTMMNTLAGPAITLNRPYTIEDL